MLPFVSGSPAIRRLQVGSLSSLATFLVDIDQHKQIILFREHLVFCCCFFFFMKHILSWRNEKNINLFLLK